MGVAVHTRYRVNQIRRLDRQVAVAEVVGQQELEELVWSPGGRGAAVEAGLVAPQRLVQQTHKLALALAQTAPQVAECLQRLPMARSLSEWAGGRRVVVYRDSLWAGASPLPSPCP